MIFILVIALKVNIVYVRILTYNIIFDFIGAHFTNNSTIGSFTHKRHLVVRLGQLYWQRGPRVTRLYTFTANADGRSRVTSDSRAGQGHLAVLLLCQLRRR